MIQFDEPAFNVYMGEVKEWGIEALHRAIEGLRCTTAVHICYGYGIKANIDWKATLGGEWRQYEEIFPALAGSRHRPGVARMHQLPRADAPVDAARRQGRAGRRHRRGERRRWRRREEVAAVIGEAAKYVAKERIIAGTNCGMAPMRRDIALGKLEALGKGAELATEEIRLRLHPPPSAAAPGYLVAGQFLERAVASSTLTSSVAET